jgi:hypothetical protein
MKAVGADHQVEATGRAALEPDIDAAVALRQCRDGIVEDRFDTALDAAKQLHGKLAARQADEAVVQRVAEQVGWEAAGLAAPVIDETHFPHRIARIAHGGQDAHAFGDGIAGAPEVDHVAIAAQMRRLLDQGRLLTAAQQPVSQGCAADAGTADGDLHDSPPHLRRWERRAATAAVPGRCRSASDPLTEGLS